MKENNFNIFISYSSDLRDQAVDLFDHLKHRGFDVWIDKRNVLLGENWRNAIQEALETTTVFVFCIGKSSSTSGGQYEEIEYAIRKSENKDKFIIPLLMEDTVFPDSLKDYNGILFYRDNKKGYEQLVDGLRQIEEKSAYKKRMLEPQQQYPNPKNLHLHSISLKNIRCFEKLELSLEEGNDWLMVLGDNASGKSTLLKSVALGLCNESEATSLLSIGGGKFIRYKEKEGEIKLTLKEKNKYYTILTTIERDDSNGEVVRKKTTPKHFPWNDVFVCAYGTHRSSQAFASYERYSSMEAVRTLFDYSAPLQNPELILLRRDKATRKKLEQALLKILMLDVESNEVFHSQSGVEVNGPWGKLPFQVLSDGYRTTSQWVLDFIGWLIYANRLADFPDFGGILIIDEIELHLHPQWQRYLVQRIRSQFPKVQVISTTHTPLVASGVVDLKSSQMIRFKLEEDGAVNVFPIQKESLDGLSADQVLATIAFEVHSTQNPDSEGNMERFVALMRKESLSKEEEEEIIELKTKLQKDFALTNPLAQEIEKEINKNLNDRLKSANIDHLDIEIKSQLKNMFKL